MQNIFNRFFIVIYSASPLKFRHLASTDVNLGLRIKELNDKSQFRKAINLFESKSKDEQFTPIAINQALRSYVELSEFNKGKEIHQQLSFNLINNQFIRTTLIRLYMKIGDINKAKEIFIQSPEKKPTMYMELLRGLCENKRHEEALEFLSKLTIEFNEYIYSMAFKICAKLADQRSLTFGKTLLENIPTKHKTNPIVLTSALHMLVQCGDMTNANEIFSRMEKNHFAYGVMINGFLKNNMPLKAIDFFFEIPEPNEMILTVFFSACAQLRQAESLIKGKNVFSQLSMKYRQMYRVQQSFLNMLTKCHDEKNAEIYFNEIQPNMMCYGSMMKMYNEMNQPEKTLDLHEEMKRKKCSMDEIIWTLLIDACSQIGHIQLCQSLVSQIPKNFFDDIWICNGLIDMWGKSGSIKTASEIFHRMKIKNNVSYTTMINVLGLNGNGVEAVRLFDNIPEATRDGWMFVCVLNACSHSGLIRQAERIFDQISNEQRSEKIYTSMIDVYSRSFMFDQAQKLIDQYEKEKSPSIAMYMAYLSGARNKKDSSLAENIFKKIRLLFPNDELSRTSARILLANTLRSNKDFAKSTDLQKNLIADGGRRVIGLSWTVINGQIHKFHAHDRSHPQFSRIEIELNKLTKELKEHGFKQDSSWITRPLIGDETEESVLNGHSERIAMALNLIQRPMPSSFQISKNLRVCGDCHEFTKWVAKIRQCTIIVRDANRLHHFYPNGKCSCNDFF